MLEGPRCDGRSHHGCNRGCRLFWKTAWLRRLDDASAPASGAESVPLEVTGRLKVMADEQRYFCQSTELLAATEPFPGRKKLWMVRVALREIRDGDLPMGRVAGLFGRWCWQMLRNAVSGEWYLRGVGKETPTLALGLQPGERVRIKSREQILHTLSERGRNRGMGISNEMTRSCGREAEVRIRVDRIIEERSGKMRELKNTVMLHKLDGDPTTCEECLCAEEMGDCPRGELMYWREIWLERVSDAVK